MSNSFGVGASKNLREFGQYQLGFTGVILWGALYLMYIMLGDNITERLQNILGIRSIALDVILIFASLIYIAGIKINGRWRWSPVLRVVGSALNSLVLFFVVAGVTVAGNGDPIVAFGSGLAIMNSWFVVLNCGDLIRAIKAKERA